ncbi:MAG: BolA family protein [Pseudomonadota bacterium]
MTVIKDRAQYIRERLTAALQPVQIDIVDDSHHHAGHTSARGGGHFQVTIVATAFAGKSLIQRHRLVYEALQDAMREEIHALSIKAYTPEETGV